MTQFEISKLLSSGFLLRASGEEVFVGCPDENINSHVFSVTYMDFWKGNSKSFGTSKLFRFPAQELIGQLDAFQTHFMPNISRNDFSESDKAGFEKSFSHIKSLIQKNEIKKAVPVVKIKTSKVPNQQDKINWLKNLLALPETLSVYGCWHAHEGFMGASPEILFEKKSGKVKTVALAGTATLTEAEALLHDEKEMNEHSFVVQDIQIQLQGQAQDITVKGPSIRRLPKLAHLYSEIEFKSTSSDEELINKLHPTAALGVFPRNQGYTWLKELPDQSERNIFGAPVLFRMEDHTVALVAIRNIQWDKMGSQIFAGCGIVAESDLEKEKSEIKLKTNSIFSSLGLL